MADKQDQILQEIQDTRQEIRETRDELRDTRRGVRESHALNERLQSDLQRLLEIVAVLPEHSRRLNSIEARLGSIELQMNVIAPAVKEHSIQTRELQDDLRQHKARPHAA